MVAITCSRKIHFCAGHRVLGHENKCANLHGHNYIAWIYAQANTLDDLGRIIDFSVLKEKVGGWIDKHWDHTTILYAEDPLVKYSFEMEANKPTWCAEFNPTAENMAAHLLYTVCPMALVKTGVTVTKVVLYETENCFAEVSL